MRRSLPLLVAALFVVTLVPAVAEATTPVHFLVGYSPSSASQAHLAIQAAGGSVERASPELGFALVSTSDPNTFLFLTARSPWIDYTETNDATRLNGGQWNGAQWNGAQWNGGQWNGAQWNGAQWNGGQWNGGQWNSVGTGAQQQAFNWTVRNFFARIPTGWSYDIATSDPGLVWQWGTFATGALKATAPAGTTKLCVLDSGVAWDHADIAPNYVAGWNAITPLASAYDDGGHGTHIAGIAAGRVGNAYGIAGVANAGILNAKVLDGNGQGLESDLAFGLVWCANQGARVAVMALSATDDGPTMDRALQYAADHDVLLLASAGNTGSAVAYPARDPRVIAVSALDGEKALASFSSHGAEVELAAPGVNVIGPIGRDAFAFGSGTSQAVAFAAGVATLARDAGPGLTAPQTRSLLVASAVDLGPSGRDASFGHGLVDAERARTMALG